MEKAFQKQQPGDEQEQVFQHQAKQSLRINKYLTAAGHCSRREADRLVEQKRVTIDGIAAEMGSQVLPGQTVMVDSQTITPQQHHVYIALNKPVGITCTTELDHPDNIVNFMDYDQRIFPIGRLDKDSSGLILLTSDGDIVNKVLRAENNHEKEYIVHLKQRVTPEFMQQMQDGVEITNMRRRTRQRTQPSRVEQLGPRSFKIILTQGLNRQIRRMASELGHSVVALRRVRIMSIRLGDLKPGQWRYLTQQELAVLHKQLNSPAETSAGQ